MNTEPQVFHPKGLKAVLGDARGRRETKGGGEAAPAPLSPAARGRVPRGESSGDAGGGGRDEPPSARSPPPPRSESIRGRPRRRRAAGRCRRRPLRPGHRRARSAAGRRRLGPLFLRPPAAALGAQSRGAPRRSRRFAQHLGARRRAPAPHPPSSAHRRRRLRPRVCRPLSRRKCEMCCLCSCPWFSVLAPEDRYLPVSYI